MADKIKKLKKVKVCLKNKESYTMFSRDNSVQIIYKIGFEFGMKNVKSIKFKKPKYWDVTSITNSFYKGYCFDTVDKVKHKNI